jgi:hypothetical protein
MQQGVWSSNKEEGWRGNGEGLSYSDSKMKKVGKRRKGTN